MTKHDALSASVAKRELDLLIGKHNDLMLKLKEQYAAIDNAKSLADMGRMLDAADKTEFQLQEVTYEIREYTEFCRKKGLS
jgi:hypothetical protein